MRISDWSSDVCSSDLTTLFNTISGHAPVTEGRILVAGREIQNKTPRQISGCKVRRTFQNGGLFGELTVLENVLAGMHSVSRAPLLGTILRTRGARSVEAKLIHKARGLLRSEEHTSELQSLMRISYAVFCWKKKKTQKNKA